MRDLEHELRELLTDERLNVPLRPGALTAIQSGVRRRRRQRGVLAAAGVAAAVAGGVLGATLLRGADDRAELPATPAPTTASYDVPWVALPLPTPWSPPLVNAPLPTLRAPLCRADQLRAGTATSNGATGIVFTSVPLRNISTSACQLIGSPQRVVAQQPGQPDVVGTRGLQLGSGGVGGDLAPGHSGYLTVETDRDCPARNADPTATRIYRSLAITLPSGTTLTLPARLDVECGLHNGGLGVQVAQSRRAPDPRRILTATLSAPATVRAGTTLDYVVTLTNPSTRPVSLQHCPGYLETGAFPNGAPIKELFGLNCRTVRTIAPESSVRYQMRLTVPAGMEAGLIDLRWSLQVMPTLPTSGATIRVLPD